MKFVTYQIAGEQRVGVLNAPGTEVTPLEFNQEEAKRGLLAIIDAEQRGVDVKSLLASTASNVAVSNIEIKAPIPRPARNIFCVGKNYHEHAKEFAGSGFDSSASMGDIPKAPIIFSKVPESVNHHLGEIVYRSDISEAIDYEAELAVIIGKPGYCISEEEALAHVWGYTIVNDVTSRDWQQRHQQWLLGKSFPTFCPMGPYAVRAKEINLSDTSVRCYVNGELRQDGNTRNLIFDVPTIIACISEAVELKAGDIIATGTPAGVGVGFNPPKYLTDGDHVAVEIDGIGRLENAVRKR